MANQTNHRVDQHAQSDGTMPTSDDAAIKTLLESVSVPENLNERIKSRLRVAGLIDPCLASSSFTDQTNTDQTEKSSNEPLIVADPGVRFGERTRRAILMLAMAAMLAGLAFLANQWRQPSEGEWLVKQCHDVLGLWEQDNPANLELETNLANVPSSVREQLTRVTMRGTRSLAALGSRFKGTLYRLDAVGGNSLVLLKLSDLPTVRGLNSRFSVLPTPSGGWSLVALQLNNETYVLAAQCTQQQLMSFIRRPVVT